MKTTSHTIEIDALAAFKTIGLDLRINPFAEQCVEVLHEHLNECITPKLLANVLAEAAGAKKKRRRKSKQTGLSAEIHAGGQADVR